MEVSSVEIALPDAMQIKTTHNFLIALIT